MKIILWFVFVLVLDVSFASYFLYSCNYKFDAFTVGIGVTLQIYAVLQINRVEWFLDFGGRYQGYFNIFIIAVALHFIALGLSWETKLGKSTKYGYCAPKTISIESLRILTQ